MRIGKSFYNYFSQKDLILKEILYTYCDTFFNIHICGIYNQNQITFTQKFNKIHIIHTSCNFLNSHAALYTLVNHHSENTKKLKYFHILTKHCFLKTAQVPHMISDL